MEMPISVDKGNPGFAVQGCGEVIRHFQTRSVDTAQRPQLSRHPNFNEQDLLRTLPNSNLAISGSDLAHLDKRR